MSEFLNSTTVGVVAVFAIILIAVVFSLVNHWQTKYNELKSRFDVIEKSELHLADKVRKQDIIMERLGNPKHYKGLAGLLNRCNDPESVLNDIRTASYIPELHVLVAVFDGMPCQHLRMLRPESRIFFGPKLKTDYYPDALVPEYKNSTHLVYVVGHPSLIETIEQEIVSSHKNFTVIAGSAHKYSITSGGYVTGEIPHLSNNVLPTVRDFYHKVKLEETKGK